MVMFLDLDISEASSETKEILYSTWIWKACSLLVKLRKSYSVLGEKMNWTLVLIMTEPDWKYDKNIYALRKWMACNKIFTTEQNGCL